MTTKRETPVIKARGDDINQMFGFAAAVEKLYRVSETMTNRFDAVGETEELTRIADRLAEMATDREDDDEQMTEASEIELLLNSFGETLADLPQSDGKHFTYDEDKRKEVGKAAFKFDRIQDGHYVDIVDSLGVMADLICHQLDVIEKLIRALKKAKEN